MNNPEKLAAFGHKRHRTKTNKAKTQHRKKYQHGPQQKLGMNPGGREG